MPFKNVVVDYPLARAMDDGFVKEPAVVTQRNFDASQHTKEAIERIKLMDGIRLHEATKVELLTYAHENDVAIIKPFMLVIARDTTHAAQLLELMESAAFFEGRYKGKLIQVDRLNIVAHDRFQEIIDEANNPQNPLRLQQVILDAPSDAEKTESVTVGSNLDGLINGKAGGVIYPFDLPLRQGEGRGEGQYHFNGVAETKAAQFAIAELNKLQYTPGTVATSKALLNFDIQKSVIQAVSEQLSACQQSLFAENSVDVADIVAKTTALMVNHTIDIPRVVVVPKGEVSYGYKPFTLNLSGLNLQPSERDIIIQSLQINEQELMTAQVELIEAKPENVLVYTLIDYDDISYDDHADLLYDLARQTVEHLQGYLSEDEVNNVLYPVQKFDSDTERRFAVILERDAQKWFKPAKGQFKIYYKDGAEHPEYVPDFVAKTEDYVLMVETKSQAEMGDSKVQAKADAAVTWCENAGAYLLKNGGITWKYLLIPHDEVKENFQLRDYIRKFERL